MIRLCVLCILLVSLERAWSAEAGKLDETAKIERLLKHLGETKDAKFIRNGSEYDSVSAVKFLRAKWKQDADSMPTAADFIARAATKSSTTGKPYLLKLKDNTEIPVVDFLNAELKAIEAPDTAIKKE